MKMKLLTRTISTITFIFIVCIEATPISTFHGSMKNTRTQLATARTLRSVVVVRQRHFNLNKRRHSGYVQMSQHMNNPEDVTDLKSEDLDLDLDDDVNKHLVGETYLREERKRICKGDNCRKKCAETVKRECKDCSITSIKILQFGCKGRCQKPQRKFLEPPWSFTESVNFLKNCEEQATSACNTDCIKTNSESDCKNKCTGVSINKYLTNYCSFFGPYNNETNTPIKLKHYQLVLKPNTKQNSDVPIYIDIDFKYSDLEQDMNDHLEGLSICSLSGQRFCKGDVCKRKCIGTVAKECEALHCSRATVRLLQLGCRGRCQKPQHKFVEPPWSFQDTVDFLKYCESIKGMQACNFLDSYYENLPVVLETTSEKTTVISEATAATTDSDELTTTSSYVHTASTTPPSEEDKPTSVSEAITTVVPTTTSSTIDAPTTTTTTTVAPTTTTTTTVAPTTTTSTIEVPTTTTTTTTTELPTTTSDLPTTTSELPTTTTKVPTTTSSNVAYCKWF